MRIVQIVSICIVILEITGSEMHCSKFHYEEQTLEKIIRMAIEMQKLQVEMAGLKENIAHLSEPTTRQILKHLSQEPTTTYIRWGRTSCPKTPGTNTVYYGYMAGNFWDNYGGGANELCLPADPTLRNYVIGHQHGATLYGTELEIAADVFPQLFNDKTRGSMDHDLPCVVCETPRQTSLMIPGRYSCHGNWTTEYVGYLVSSNNGWKGSSSYTCLDMDYDAIPGNRGNNEHVLKLVEVQCGTLPCPPYVEGAEMPCVVCTK